MSEIMLQAMEKLQRERDELRRETIEQCRLLGMGGERELKLLGEVERLKRELDEARTQEKWHFDNYVYTQELYNELREERDRLAEALRGLSQPLGRYDYTVAELDDIVRKIALEALAAAKGEEPEDPHKYCRGGGGNNFHCGCKYA
jgi:chromosome segregation ATPase